MACLRLALLFSVLGLITPLLAIYQWAVFRRPDAEIAYAPQLWYRIMARMLRLRIHIRGAPADDRPLLIVSNHISWTDVIALGATIRGAFVAKAEVADWPIIGPLSRIQGTILVDRTRKEAAGRQVEELTAALEKGRAMILFAEGTTSDGTMLLPFKTSLFGAAGAVLREGRHPRVHIQPVAIAYTHMGGIALSRRLRAKIAWTGDEAFWPHLRRLTTFNAIDVELRFGTPLEFTETSERKAMARQTEARVRELFAAALAGRPVEAPGESR